jgi:hypothetical protein
LLVTDRLRATNIQEIPADILATRISADDKSSSIP